MAESKLYVMATPLGNRNDISLRALELLRSLENFCAEDTREFHKLLALYGIEGKGKRVQSYANHNLKRSTEVALEWLRNGADVGLVCDRGTPALSDPGYLLVQQAYAEGFPVTPVPGASSITAALSVSGFSTDRFLFLGFLPRSGKSRKESFELIRRSGLPACIFESPQRIKETAIELGQQFPNGELFAARELTKVFESLTRVSLNAVESENWVEKGEFVLVVNPGAPPEEKQPDWLDELQRRTCSDKEWAKGIAAQYQVSAKEAYDALQRKKGKLEV